MSRLFITGMARSGTSLLDKLLCGHDALDVLSQPFPLIFVEVKRRFLEQLGTGGHFVLNDDLVSRDYPVNLFASYLAELETGATELAGLFHRMTDYSGQKARSDRTPPASGEAPLVGFFDLLEHCFQYFQMDRRAAMVGMKEIMCEEFIPYLGSRGYKCIVIIRDPRDVLASANYPNRQKYLGAKKPALFLLRTWRKSVEFAQLLKNEDFFYFLRYEDLVKNPMKELNRIAEFLAISHFEESYLERGIRDRNGRLWQANSSGQTRGSDISSSSVGAYARVLSLPEVAYAEAVCAYEMRWLGYLTKGEANRQDAIRAFKDVGVKNAPDLPADFSQRPEHIAQELQRLDDFKGFYSCN